MLYIKDGFNVLAQMTYSLGNGFMIIDHTEVDDRLQGQQAGKKCWTGPLISLGQKNAALFRCALLPNQ